MLQPPPYIPVPFTPWVPTPLPFQWRNSNVPRMKQARSSQQWGFCLGCFLFAWPDSTQSCLKNNFQLCLPLYLYRFPFVILLLSANVFLMMLMILWLFITCVSCLLSVSDTLTPEGGTLSILLTMVHPLCRRLVAQWLLLECLYDLGKRSQILFLGICAMYSAICW